MSDGIRTSAKETLTVVAPIVLGSISGFITLLSVMEIREFWSGAIGYNKSLSLAADLNIIVFSLVAFILIGVLFIILSLGFPKSRKRTLMLGTLSASAAFAAGLAYLTPDRPIYTYKTFFDGLTFALRANQFYLLLAVLVFMAVALYGSVAYITARKKYAARQIPVRANKLDFIAVTLLAAVMLVVLIVPLAAIVSGKSLGLVERTSPSSNDIYETLIKVSVLRIDNSTIQIVNDGGEDSVALRKDIPFTIYLTPTCRLASNMEAIQNSGLSVTMTPAGGLENRAGASVIISGKDVERDAPANAEYGSVHVAVMGHYKDGSHSILAQADI